jgi:hypothetical protein
LNVTKSLIGTMAGLELPLQALIIKTQNNLI